MKQPGTDPLLPGLIAGDQRVYAALYDRLAGRLYRYALVMLGRPEDAEDAVQEVFASLVRGRAALEAVRDLDAYLFVAARRAAGRLAARRARQPMVSDEIVAEATSSATESQANPRGERLERALRALPKEQREVIAMKIDGELTFGQIAQTLDISPNTAASRYRYALERLRRSLGEM